MDETKDEASTPKNSSEENDNNPIIDPQISSSSSSNLNPILPEIYVPQTSRELTPEEVSFYHSLLLENSYIIKKTERIMTL